MSVDVLGNSLFAWCLALALAIGVAALAVGFRGIVLYRLIRYAEGTATRFDDYLADALKKTKILLWIPVALFTGSLVLRLPVRVEKLLQYVALAAALLQVALWADQMIRSWLQSMLSRWEPSKATTMSMLGFVARVLLWSVLFFMALDTFGFDITALIAGLGIGGIAVALAAQTILGDLLASLSIVFDKPFLIGDFIVVDDQMGTIEHIGIKTTRIRSLSGEQVVFSNADLLKSRIRNFKRMYERRVVFKIGIRYETPPPLIERTAQIIKDIVQAQPGTRLDRSHLQSFGEFALIFETVYHVLDPDYNVYMDTHHAIALALIRRFKEEGIEFAYPTQTVQVVQAASG